MGGEMDDESLCNYYQCASDKKGPWRTRHSASKEKRSEKRLSLRVGKEAQRVESSRGKRADRQDPNFPTE
jgi:hypothetical protein